MRSLFTVIIAAALVVGCAKDPSKDAAAAKVEDPTPAAGEAAPDPNADGAPKAAGDPKAEAPATPTENKEPTARKVIDLTGQISFVGSKVSGSHSGLFKEWTGGILLGDSLEAARLTFEVKTASVHSDFEERTKWSGKLDDHLKNEDFFDTEKFPTASFTSSRIAPQTQGTTTHIVTGDLTMKGIKKTVTFPATISLTDTEFSAKAEFTINRKDWGIVYPGKPDDLIRDGVVMNIDLKGVR